MECKIGKYNTLQVDTSTVYWNGFFYVENHSDGRESVLHLMNQLLTEKSIDFDKLRGHYIIFIEFNDGRKICFTDNSGVYRLYKYNELVSDSFLELAKRIPKDAYYWNTNKLLEFAHWGYVYGKETLVQGIERISSDCYLYLNNGRWQWKTKNLQDFEQPNTSFELNEYFEHLQKIVSSKKLSLDITGGLDSRYLLSWFGKQALNVELCVSGYGTSIDQQIASEVAEAVQLKLHNVQHHTNDFTEYTLQNIVQQSDGQLNVMVFHRLNQYYVARKERGVELAMQGGGGEVLGDHWWLQDFPFYNKTKFSIFNFARLRLFSNALDHDLFWGKFKENSEELLKRNIKYLESFRSKTNTQTWDKIAYYFKHHNAASSVLRFYSKFVEVYSPYLEREVHRYGYHMPRKQRMFDQLQIKHIHQHLPLVCSIRTTRGPHLKYNPSNFCQAGYYVFSNRLQRFFMKMKEVFLKKTYDRNKLDNPELAILLRKSKLAVIAINFWKQEGLLKPELEMNSVSDKYLSNLVSLYLIQENISQPSNSHQTT